MPWYEHNQIGVDKQCNLLECVGNFPFPTTISMTNIRASCPDKNEVVDTSKIEEMEVVETTVTNIDRNTSMTTIAKASITTITLESGQPPKAVDSDYPGSYLPFRASSGCYDKSDSCDCDEGEQTSNSCADLEDTCDNEDPCDEEEDLSTCDTNDQSLANSIQSIGSGFSCSCSLTDTKADQKETELCDKVKDLLDPVLKLTDDCGMFI